MRQKWLQKPPLGTPINCSHPSAKGRVGDWIFNEGGGDLVNDLSGNANHGTLKNMAFPPTTASGWNPGRAGVGLKFDGVNDYVDCGNDASLNLTTHLTVSYWVKFTSSATWRTLIGRWSAPDEGHSNWEHVIRNSAGYIRFYVENDGCTTETYRDAAVAINDGDWHLATGVFDGPNQELLMYIDGEISNGTLSGTLSTSLCNATTYNLKIGCSPGQYFPGTIDQVRIYNRALSAEEVLDSYLDPFARFERNNLWDYVSAPPVGAVMNQFQKGNIGADLYDGVLIA